MRITKSDKDIYIPNWLVFMGILVVDNVASNVLKVIDNKTVTKVVEKVEKGTQ